MCQPTKEEFLKRIDGLKMRIVRSDGIDRHIIFRKEDSSCEWFELITWKGSLCVNGDYGTYMFSRTEDMFKFFRGDNLRINPSYWSEKCLAEDKHDKISKFSSELFKENVIEWFENWWESKDEDTPTAINCNRRPKIGHEFLYERGVF